MSSNHAMILGEYIVNQNNYTSSFTFASIPTDYDVIEIHVAGSLTRDQDSGATGQTQYLACSIQDTHDPSSTGYTADVSRMHMSWQTNWRDQNKYSWAWRGSVANPIYFGYVPVNMQNNGSDTASKAFAVTFQLMGPNSGAPKQVFWRGTCSDSNAGSLSRKTQGCFGLDIQGNTTVRDWGKGPWRSLRMGLSNYGTYNAATSPTFKAGTVFQMIGYKGSGEGW